MNLYKLERLIADSSCIACDDDDCSREIALQKVKAVFPRLIAVAQQAEKFYNEPCFCDDDQNGLCRSCKLTTALDNLEQAND